MMLWLAAIDLYLLTGVLTMLLMNELAPGEIPRGRFLLGALIWPEIWRVWLREIAASYYRRRRG